MFLKRQDFKDANDARIPKPVKKQILSTTSQIDGLKKKVQNQKLITGRRKIGI